MYLGIDLGTSELKLVLLSQQHQVVATARSALSISQPRPLWSEQQPEHWWQALEAALQQLAASHPRVMPEVRAIGLSGQMHGAVLLDDRKQVLRPAILWNDGRSAAQCEALSREHPELTRITGNLAMPGFTAPKLRWVREHEPAVFARIDCVLLPKDYLRLRLTGATVSDCSDASGTLWLDVGARRWSPAMLAACGLSEAQMPRLVEGSQISARLLAPIAARWGLRADLPVAGGGGDNAASAVGMGRVGPGEGFVSLGTSGVVFAGTDGFRPDPARGLHAFCHALPQRWHQMSVMLSAASAVSWAARVFGFADAAALLSAAQSLSDQDRRQAPIFLPYLSGERSPHNNPHAQGVLFGLGHAQHGASLAYAVVEGVSFGLLDGYHTLSSRPAIRELSLVGGGARSSYWAQLLSSVLGLPLLTHDGAEAGAALGAARLAWLADGGAAPDVLRPAAVAVRYEPQTGAHEWMSIRHARFQKLYSTLRARFSG